MTLPITIAYGSLTIGGSSTDYYPVGSYGYEEDRLQGWGIFRSDVVVRGSSASDLAGNVSAMKTELEKVSQSVTVTINSQTVVSWSHSSNTGFSSHCRFLRVEDHPANGSLAEVWSLAITVGLPMSQKGGRRNSSWSVTYSPSRIREITLQAEFTALSSNDALAQYQAASGMADFEAAVKSHTGITYWRLISENYSPTDTSSSSSAVAAKTLTATKTFREITADQYAGAGWSMEGFVEPQVNIVRRHVTTTNSHLNGYFPEPGFLVVVTFSSSVNHSLYATAASLHALYESTLIPYLTNLVAEVFGAQYISLVDETNGIDKSAHGFIGTTLVYRCAGRTGVISFKYSEMFDVDFGLLPVPLSGGGALDYSVYQGPASVVRSVSMQKVYVAGTSSPLPDLSIAKDIEHVSSGTAAAVAAVGNTFGNNPAVQAIGALAGMLGGVGAAVEQYVEAGADSPNIGGPEASALAALKAVPVRKTLTRVPLFDGLRGIREPLIEETMTVTHSFVAFATSSSPEAEEGGGGGGNQPQSGDNMAAIEISLLGEIVG